MRLPAQLRDRFGRRVLVIGHVTPGGPDRSGPPLTIVRGNRAAPTRPLVRKSARSRLTAPHGTTSPTTSPTTPSAA